MFHTEIFQRCKALRVNPIMLSLQDSNMLLSLVHIVSIIFAKNTNTKLI